MRDLVTLYPDLEELIGAQLLDLGSAAAGDFAESCEDLCVFMRAAAIGALLMEMDSDRFYHMLMRSGLTRRYLLSKTPAAEKQAGRFCRITRANGFFDAVAADRFDISVEIARLSPPKWNRKFEYEDDYCYIRFLHETVLGGEQAIKEEILKRFEEILEGQKSTRYDVLAAFLARDADQFAAAFATLLDERTADLDFEQKSFTRNEVEFAAGRYVFVEGLALLRIAAKEGIKTEEEYQYCPIEARVPMQLPFPDDRYPR